MTTRRLTLYGAALLGMLGATAAHAQGDGGDRQLSSFQLMNNRVLLVTPDGRVLMRTVGEPSMAGEIMRDARPMPMGSVMFMRDGTLYAAPDRAMADGTMLSKAIDRLPAR